MSISVVAPDGRALEVIAAGPEDGVPVITQHGTPGAARPYGGAVAAAAERGLRIVAYSRPGYGGSDRLSGRSVADCAADVAAIADALGYERFYTIGTSGGGPHALACAALLGERVIAAAAVASGAPHDGAGLDWKAGMGRENLEEFAAVQAGETVLHAYLEREAAGLADVTGAGIVAALGDLVSEVDRGALSGAFGEHIAAQIARSLSSGIWGWFDDDMAFFDDWGFDLDQIAVPLSIWHGAHDRFVPIAHGEWLAAQLPRAKAHLRPDDGHLSLTVTGYGEILDELVGG